LEKERIILGIDPGTTVMGYAIIKIEKKTIIPLTIGIMKLNKLNSHFVRLHKIFERILFLVDDYKITELSIEAQFYSKNVQSVLKLGRAQGAAIIAALHRGVDIYEYAPNKIKMSITGNGFASKEQVAITLQKMLNLEKEGIDITAQLDATDALATAVCHFYQKSSNLENGEKKYKSWSDFAKQKNIKN